MRSIQKLLLIPSAVYATTTEVTWDSDDAYATPYVLKQPEVAESLPPTTEVIADERSMAASDRVVIIPHTAKWTHAHQKRFTELVELEVLGEATQNELAELAAIMEVRRELVSPRTGSEIFADYQMRQATAHLKQALQHYFHVNENTQG